MSARTNRSTKSQGGSFKENAPEKEAEGNAEEEEHSADADEKHFSPLVTMKSTVSAVSLGDFVLAGGELAALAVVEAVARLRPGVLGNNESPKDESFAGGLLEYPQWTRPAEFRGLEVPAVLRSGDHGRVARFRRASALARTRDRRPDLLEQRGGLTDDERSLLVEFGLDEPGSGIDA